MFDRSTSRAPVFVLAALLLVVTVGCGESEEEIAQREAAEAAERAEAIDAFEMRVPALVVEQARAELPADPLDRALDSTRDQLHNADLVASLYKQGKGQAFLVEGASLSAAGARTFEALTGATADALVPANYHAEALSQLQEQLGGGEEAAKLALSPAQRDALDAALAQVPDEATEAEVQAALMTALKAATEGTEQGQWLERKRAQVSELSGQAMEMELLLADGALRYARDMKHFNMHGVPEATLKSKGEAKLIEERQRAFFEALQAAAQSDEAAEEVFVGLYPFAAEQYAKMRDVVVRYEGIVASGGWPVKMPYFPKPKKGAITRYKPGLKRYPDDSIRLLKERLAGEKLYEGPIDNTWDKAFTKALRRYRMSNLLGEKVWIDYETLQAMKVPAEYRLAQVKINMQRLRQSRLGHEDYYVYVNIPKYIAQVWDGGKKAMEFNVVVGSRKKWHKKNRKTRQWEIDFQDATPLLSAQMDTLVFNPFWTVPARLRKQLKKQAKDDPNFWKDNGYEVTPYGSGEIIRQKPGINNALGQVKFLFPNSDDIYMHDTPKKGLFREVVRAFSHGCVRVHEPLKLAQYILSRENEDWSKRRVQISAKSGVRARIGLKDGPMVHTDYVTVEVSEEDEVMFYWDIYHWDIAQVKEMYGIEGPWGPHYP